MTIGSGNDEIIKLENQIAFKYYYKSLEQFARYLHQTRYIYFAYGLIDSLSNVINITKLIFEAYYLASSISYIHEYHQFLSSTLGIAILVILAPIYILASAFGSYFDDDNPSSLKRKLAFFVPYIRDSLKPARWSYKGTRNLIGIINYFSGGNVIYLILPIGIVLIFLAIINRLWYRTMKEERKCLQAKNNSLIKDLLLINNNLHTEQQLPTTHVTWLSKEPSLDDIDFLPFPGTSSVIIVETSPQSIFYVDRRRRICEQIDVTEYGEAALADFNAAMTANFEGCPLHQLSLQEAIQQNKTSCYVFDTNKDTLSYINFYGDCRTIKLQDLDRFKNGITKETTWLDTNQVLQLITENGGHIPKKCAPIKLHSDNELGKIIQSNVQKSIELSPYRKSYVWIPSDRPDSGLFYIDEKGQAQNQNFNLTEIETFSKFLSIIEDRNALDILNLRNKLEINNPREISCRTLSKELEEIKKQKHLTSLSKMQLRNLLHLVKNPCNSNSSNTIKETGCDLEQWNTLYPLSKREELIHRQEKTRAQWALFSAFYMGLFDQSLYFYLGAMLIVPLSPSMSITVLACSLILIITSVITRIYEEYSYQRKLNATAIDAELQFCLKEINIIIDEIYDKILLPADYIPLNIELCRTESPAGVADRPDESDNEDNVVRPQKENRKQIKNIPPLNDSNKNALKDLQEALDNQLNLYTKKQKELCNEVVLSYSFALLEGLTNGLAAHGVLSALILTILGISSILSVSFPPALVIACTITGICSLCVFAAHSLYKHHNQITETRALMNATINPELHNFIQDLKNEPAPIADIKNSYIYRRKIILTTKSTLYKTIFNPSEKTFFSVFECLRLGFSNGKNGPKIMDESIGDHEPYTSPFIFFGIGLMFLVTSITGLFKGLAKEVGSQVGNDSSISLNSSHDSVLSLYEESLMADETLILNKKDVPVQLSLAL